MSGNMRRMQSIPAWETLEEPFSDSDDAEDKDDGEDEIMSATSSHITRSSVSAVPSRISGTRGAVGSVRNTFTDSNQHVRPPPSTQPGPGSSSSVLDYDSVMRRRRDVLATLNTPGQGQMESNNRTRENGSHGAMPPPLGPSHGPLRKEKERVPAFSATQPTSSSFGSSVSARISKHARPSATASSPSDKRTSEAIRSNASTSPVNRSNGAATQTSTRAPSGTAGPSASQPQPRPRITNPISAHAMTHFSRKTGFTRKPSKGKEKEVIDLLGSDDETMGAPRSQVPPRPRPRKKADSLNKSPVLPSSSQEQSSFVRNPSSSSEDEFPRSVSQAMVRSDKNWSPGKPSANHSRRNVGADQDKGSDGGHASSLSQASRKHSTSDALSDSPSRDRSDELRPVSKSLSTSASARDLFSSQDPERSPNRGEYGRSISDVLPSTQPASVGRDRVGPTRPRPLTQRTTASWRRPRPGRLTNSSAVRPNKDIIDLGTVELLDDDEVRPEAKRSNTSPSHVECIDLTLDDDDLPSPSALSSRPAGTLKDTPPRAVASTQPTQSGIESRGSPPAVRPKPRVSAIPKEKMVVPEPQPAHSRPLDVSRRHAQTGGSTSDGAFELGPVASTQPTQGNSGITSHLSSSMAGTGAGDNALSLEVSPPALLPSAGNEKVNPSTGRQKSPMDVSSVPAPLTPSTSHREETEAIFNFDVGEAMETVYMDDCDPPMEITPASSAPTSSVDIEMQPVELESSTHQLMAGETKNPEDTTAPIERARELRSPSASVQDRETQSQADDANEVDLLLASEHSNVASRVDGPKRAEKLSVSVTSADGKKKPETLTDKLGMLDLSRRTRTTSGQDQHSEPDVFMSDKEKAGSAEGIVPLTKPGVAPTSEAQKPSVGTPLSRLGSGVATSDVVKGPPKANAAASNASTSSPGLASSPSKSSKTSSNFLRAVSPGALCAPPPVPNFMGLMGSPQKKSATSSPARRDKPPTATILNADKAESKQRDVEKSEAKKTMPNKSDISVRIVAKSIDLIPDSAERPGRAESPVDSYAELPTHPNAVDGLDGSLSPLSRARRRIPDVRPPRRLNISEIPPPSQVQAEGGTIRNLELSSSSVLSAETVSSSRKVPGKTTNDSTILPSPDAIAPNKRPTLSYSVILDPARSRGQKKTSSPNQEPAASSSLSIRGDSMPYLRKRMMEHTMQNVSTSSSPSPPTDGAAPSHGQSRSPPKRLRSDHSTDEEKATRPGSSSTGSALLSKPSSEEVAAVLDVEDADDLLESDETPALRTNTGPSVEAAPYIKFNVARKSGSKRRPKVTASVSESYVRQPAKSFKESKSATSVSQSKFRKRAMSLSSHSPSTSDVDELVVRRRGSASKRARIESSTDGETSSNRDVTYLHQSSGQSRSSGRSASRTESDASATSDDPVNIIDDPLDDHSESSADQPVTPITDIAGGVNEIDISPDLAAEGYPRKIDRYFLNRDRGPIWYQVKDVPRDLVDEVNNTPDWCTDPELKRQIFEAAIIQNTTEDEPQAPPIRIVNEVDEEPTPPFEFHYTNRLYHGNGVPPPEYRTLLGCGCVGRCDPGSKTCTCVLRQQALFKDMDYDHFGFVYDDKGCAQVHGFPIFECNDACGCTEDCTNRVVQLGRRCHVNVVKTRNKGWGVFAGRKIARGTFVGVYSGELLCHSESVTRGFLYNKIGKTYLFDIDFWHIREATAPGPINDEEDTHDAKYTIDAYHVGNFTRFLNHSCEPNCKINAVYVNEGNIEKPHIAIFASEDINPGQELTFNYYGEVDDQERENLRKESQEAYQKCLCGSKKCVGKLFTFSSATAE